MEFDIHKKEWKGLLYENGAGKKIVGHSKLKLCTFFWGHAERKWPLACDASVELISTVIIAQFMAVV